MAMGTPRSSIRRSRPIFRECCGVRCASTPQAQGRGQRLQIMGDEQVINGAATISRGPNGCRVVRGTPRPFDGAFEGAWGPARMVDEAARLSENTWPSW